MAAKDPVFSTGNWDANAASAQLGYLISLGLASSFCAPTSLGFSDRSGSISSVAVQCMGESDLRGPRVGRGG